MAHFGENKTALHASSFLDESDAADNRAVK
jgi:hypothetical protein